MWELDDDESDVTQSAVSQEVKGRTYEYSVSTQNYMLAGVDKLPADYAFAYRYELMSTEGLRGEHGLCSPARWEYKEDWFKLFETRRFDHSITSSGIGKPVLIGEALTRKESARDCL